MRSTILITLRLILNEHPFYPQGHNPKPGKVGAMVTKLIVNTLKYNISTYIL